MHDLYNTINELCKEKKITPGKMCNDIGISRGLITDLKMNRKQTLTGTTLKKIASYLGVSVDFLLNGGSSEFDEVDEIIEALKDNPGMRILFSKTKNASTEDINKIIKLVDSFKEFSDE